MKTVTSEQSSLQYLEERECERKEMRKGKVCVDKRPYHRRLYWPAAQTEELQN